MNATPAERTFALIEAVLELIGTPCDDRPRYRDKAQAVLALCTSALATIQAAQDEAQPAAPEPAARVAPTTGPGILGLRIAELAAGGKGVREIARQLGVNASTVSRQLAKLGTQDVACNT